MDPLFSYYNYRQELFESEIRLREDLQAIKDKADMLEYLAKNSQRLNLDKQHWTGVSLQEGFNIITNLTMNDVREMKRP